MALRGRRIKYFLELWWLVGSGGFTIWVSSTSFQKSNIAWPQQPPAEKVLKFNMIFHDSTQNFFFSKHPKKLNLLAWMTLKSSVVIFQALEALQPQWSQQPQQPRWPQWPWKPHFIKKITDPDGLIIPGTKMTNTCCFLKNGSSKIQFFTNIWQPFCLRLLRLFLKLVHKTQMVKPPKPTNHLDSRKNWSF